MAYYVIKIKDINGERYYRKEFTTATEITKKNATRYYSFMDVIRKKSELIRTYINKQFIIEKVEE